MSYRQLMLASRQRAVYATPGMRMMIVVDMGSSYKHQIDQEFGRCMEYVRR